MEAIKFKDVFNPYFVEHTKNLNLFTVSVFLRFDDDNDPQNHKKVYQITSLITFKASTIQQLQQN